MKFKKRTCPLCGSQEVQILFSVLPDIFIPDNHSLDKKRIKELGFDKAFNENRIVECKECNFFYVDYILEEEHLLQYYEECIIADKSLEKIYSPQNRVLNSQKASSLLSYFDKFKKQNLNVLDYGCGWGAFLQQISGEGINIYGIEYDKRKIQYCDDIGINICTDIKKLSAFSKIDIFFTNQVFEHLVDPVDTLLSIKEYLSSDFVGYFAVPNFSREKMLQIKVDIGNSVGNKNLNIYEHINYFTPETVCRLMEKCGFEVFNIHTGVKITKQNLKTTSFYFRTKSKL